MSPRGPLVMRSRALRGKPHWRRAGRVVRLDDVFFFETFAFVIVFPICWWIGGLVAQHAERDTKPRGRPPAEVIDLAEWRRRRTGSRASGQ